MKIKYFLCVFLFIISLYARELKWHITNGTEGIHVADIDIYYSNKDTLYAIGEKFLISTDGGESWSPINGPTTDIGALKVDPYNSKIIYVSHYGVGSDANDISITTDGGNKWKRLFIGRRFPSPIIEIDPVNLKTVYVVQGPGILHRSSDHFQTWDTLYPPGVDMTSLVISPSDNNIIYAGYKWKILKSIDKGKKWIELPFPIKINSWTNLAVDPTNSNIVYACIYSNGDTPGGVYKSMDGGFTWIEKNDGLSKYDWDINAVLINPQNPNVLYIGTGDKENNIFFITFDGGNHWYNMNNGLPDSAHISSIIYHPIKNKIYVSVNSSKNSSGIYSCNDITFVENQNLNIEKNFSLYQNYPNPFNLNTTIKFRITKKEHIRLTVYDILGKEVVKLIEGSKNPGVYKVNFNASGLPSGTYFYKLKVGQNVLVRKALIIK